MAYFRPRGCGSLSCLDVCLLASEDGGALMEIHIGDIDTYGALEMKLGRGLLLRISRRDICLMISILAFKIADIVLIFARVND